MDERVGDISKRLVTVADAAARLGITYYQCLARAQRGDIPGYVRIGRSNFIDAKALERFIKEHQGGDGRKGN